MKLWRIAFMMLAAFYLASCKPSARQTTADAEQPTDSTEAVTSADTLRLVITDKHLAQTDFLIRRTQNSGLNSYNTLLPLRGREVMAKLLLRF